MNKFDTKNVAAIPIITNESTKDNKNNDDEAVVIKYTTTIE